MSIYPIPTELIPGMKDMEASIEKFTRDISALIPKEFSGAANLMAHPLAAGAAMTALGAGMASQAIGMWIGSVAATMDAAQKVTGLGMPFLDPAERDVPAWRAPESGAARVMAAVETLAADVESAARDAVEVGIEAARDIAADAGAAIETVAAVHVGMIRTATAAVADEVAVAEVQAIPTGADAVAEAAPVAEPPVVNPALAEAPVAGPAPLSPAPPAGIDRPDVVDDLKAISGVGPKLERVLNDLGIWTFAQIAGLGEAEIAWLDEHLGFRGRIGRDDWVGQASRLAQGR